MQNKNINLSQHGISVLIYIQKANLEYLIIHDASFTKSYQVFSYKFYLSLKHEKYQIIYFYFNSMHIFFTIKTIYIYIYALYDKVTENFKSVNAHFLAKSRRFDLKTNQI